MPELKWEVYTDIHKLRVLSQGGVGRAYTYAHIYPQLDSFGCLYEVYIYQSDALITYVSSHKDVKSIKSDIEDTYWELSDGKA